VSGAGVAGVVLDSVCKRYADVVAVDDVSLTIRQGEFFSLLGPSGCGKTTTLRMIAGFERPDSGRISIGDADVTETPPHRRRVNTVFQSYALFPHLTVGENVGFGLRFGTVSKQEKQARIEETLELVRLAGMGRRKPHQLSGGQQQRVALARALILSPDVLLLDEPLGALDAKLRRELQVELKSIQREVGITFIFVTHDQEEALTMSDRLAVMLNGGVEQLGTPREVYEQPATTFVADFIGVSNLMRAWADGSGGVEVGDVRLSVAKPTTGEGVVRLSIRPERIRIEERGAQGENRVPARIERFVYLGSTTQVFVTLPGDERLQALVANAEEVDEYDVGVEVSAYLPPDALRVLVDEESAGQ
jgi:spermidine/putrescine transport system ATP-binding protein